MSEPFDSSSENTRMPGEDSTESTNETPVEMAGDAPQDVPADTAEPESPFAEDGTYRMVRPDEHREEPPKSYEDASYHTQEQASAIPPRYYTPEKRRTKEPRQPKAGRSKKMFWQVACLCLVCALLGGIGGGAIFSAISGRSAAPEQTAATPAPTSSGVLTTQATSSGAMSASDIYAAACQQVVGITTELTYQNFFGQTSSQAVSGSGFIITSDGYILTNYHVISYAAQYDYDITVMTYDGTSYTAKIVGVDSSNDIAVLKIDATGLTPATFGDSDEMAVGDTVYAVGNPLGELQFSMTTGHISALDRTITTDESSIPINMFQIDAAVNSGNSGGPVYNDAGQVIGIVTAKYSSSGVEGLGFAIPVNDAVNIANELMENGVVINKVQLGITTQTIPAQVAQYYNMVEGACVLSINEGSCAEKAGLQINDIITAVGGKTVASSDALKAALRGYAPGDTTELTIYRAGKTTTITVTLDEADETTQQEATQQQPQNIIPYSIG